MSGKRWLTVAAAFVLLVAGTARGGQAGVPHGKPAAGRLLVASQQLSDPNFGRTVILLVSYDGDGAMGLVLNHPTPMKLGAVFSDIPQLRSSSYRVHVGGPVMTNHLLMLVRSDKAPASSKKVFDDVYVSGDRDLLIRLGSQKKAGNRFRVFVGHSGWGPQQLDAEIARGDWYVTGADVATVFDTPTEQMWPRLIDRLSGNWASWVER